MSFDVKKSLLSHTCFIINAYAELSRSCTLLDFPNMFIINTVIRGAHDIVRTCVISYFQSEVEKFIFPHTFCLLSILSYEARMIMYARALYSSFKV